MNAEAPEVTISRIAAAIGEPARVRILYSLLDGHARTSTELAVVAEVGLSTASVHLNRLHTEKLVKQLKQGKHRYYSLEGPDVARALESLGIVASGSRDKFVPSTPSRLLAARTCYDHIAGRLGVLVHDRFKAMDWLSTGQNDGYELEREGWKALEALGVDLATARTQRRKFAFACLDWSERQPHLGGALGCAVLNMALRKKWVVRQLDSRALTITSLGRREMAARWGVGCTDI